MSNTQQAHLCERRSSFRDSVCFGWQCSHKPCVSHANMIWFFMGFLTLPPPHTCFRLGPREWLLVYTCVECTGTTGQLYQHTGLLSLCCSDPRVLRHFHSRMPLHLHHQVKRLSQHAILILKYTDDAYRCQVCLNRCQTGFMCGQVCSTGSILCLFTFTVSPLETLHCDTHMFYVKVFVWN